jgi:hypothetical protein
MAALAGCAAAVPVAAASGATSDANGAGGRAELVTFKCGR